MLGFSDNMTAKPSGFADGVAGGCESGVKKDSGGLELSKWKKLLPSTEYERTARVTVSECRRSALTPSSLVQAPLWTDWWTGHWGMGPDLPGPLFLLRFLPSGVSSSTFRYLVPVGDFGKCPNQDSVLLLCAT